MQAVVQDYQTNRLTFNNLSLFNIKQLCFLKCFMFEWFDLSMRIKKKTVLCGKVFVNFSYFLSLHESFSNNIFLFIVISILERSSSQFFFDFNPSIFCRNNRVNLKPKNKLSFGKNNLEKFIFA